MSTRAVLTVAALVMLALARALVAVRRRGSGEPVQFDPVQFDTGEPTATLQLV